MLKSALAEDIAGGDITSRLVIKGSPRIKAVVLAKENGVFCGVDILKEAFPATKKDVTLTLFKQDGDPLIRGEGVAQLFGSAKKILAYERVVLNFISMLSGVSTLTNQFVKKIQNTKVEIKDTRKTTPLFRNLQKYAVRVGGASNHRMRLDDAVLIKDNHLRVGGYLVDGQIDKEKFKPIIKLLRQKTSLPLEVEVETFSEFQAVAEFYPDIIMLDNFSLANLKKVVSFRNKYYPRIKLEASGGVNLTTILKIAKSGVDYISVGAITHSAKAIDFSLEIL
ncbi:MAG: carboxylating nicotinate-nucleotide diphosphorylase [Candidatus Omnitrophica bacterium]|nr:carboxylating nicotinate-nucleotide diphosphorylase [Candidatus Omnitrophota bacterium]